MALWEKKVVRQGRSGRATSDEMAQRGVGIGRKWKGLNRSRGAWTLKYQGKW